MSTQARHAVVTGGTGSLGSAIAAELRLNGWNADAPGSGRLDVRDEGAIQSYFQNRPVDLLVCAAGAVGDAPLARLGPQAWEDLWGVNYEGAAACARAVIPAMVEAGAGHIVFLSSHSALDPPVGQAPYAAAKAALLGLTADLAARHGPSNIRVNAILPGFVPSRITSRVTESRMREVLASHALGRFNTAGAVARFLCFLHHDLPHTSGQVFQLDSRVKNLRLASNGSCSPPSDAL